MISSLMFMYPCGNEDSKTDHRLLADTLHQAKLQEAIAITEREKSDAIRHAELLQHQVYSVQVHKDQVFLEDL